MKLGNGFIEYRNKLRDYFITHYYFIDYRMTDSELGAWILKSPFGFTIEQEAELLADELFENDKE